jgi:hypothetical protein
MKPKPKPKKVRLKPGRKPGDPTNTGPARGLSVKCWWGCGELVYGGTLRAHWRDCPRRPSAPG